jgi:phospholipid/cholesterol/gamma-HCH transport system permease protein
VPAYETTSEGSPVVVFRENLERHRVKALWDELGPFLKKHRGSRITLDFRNVETIDSAGAAFLQALHREGKNRRVELRHRSVAPAVDRYLRTIQWEEDLEVPSGPRVSHGMIYQIGQTFYERCVDCMGIIAFTGRFVLSLAGLVRRPKGFRWKETLYYIELCGTDAIPIVFLISFLMGLVMAFQAAVQLRQFGANIFVADLVAISLARELGPVLTAVILAGRSGSAFAAEIGTMVVHEEIDALTVMDFDITRFLVLPKVFALVAVAPLLTLVANASGIFGGLVVGVTTLDLTANAFIEEAMRILRTQDVVGGLVKSVAFAAFIALVGCLRGLQTGGEADSVGRQTTSAVVTGIFLIIMLDAVFTVIYHVFEI